MYKTKMLFFSYVYAQFKIANTASMFCFKGKNQIILSIIVDHIFGNGDFVRS